MEDIYAQCSSTSSYSCSSIVDPENELIDPTPDVRALFLQFNDQFFGGALAACEVRWSPRMTLCAGLCHYEGRGGLCSIRLSVPLLKLRPRKDLVQTLLHEMIHAYLFVTANNRDHDAHGSEFQKHMHRINQATGANITIYHSFHDEVNLYKQHWWRCTGPCRDRKPFYGWVKRAMNRTPGPNDLWWKEHQETCNGQFDKVKEPEGYSKTQKAVKSKHNAAVKSSKKSRVSDGQSRIESYFTSRHKNNNAVSDNCDKQIFLSVTDNTSDTDDVYVECPNCSCIIRESSINNHLDQCLLTTAN